jgi:hypothetical protein
MNAADPRCAMLFEMTQSAHRLGMAFAAEAERAEGMARRIEFVQLFDRCFFAVRVGIALELRLKREARLDAARGEREGRGDLADHERDAPEVERPERLERPEAYTERDRDRDVERASLPLLLSALHGIAADAAALPGPPPAELLTLQELLAQYASEAATSPAPAAGPALRARLTASAAASPGRGSPVGVLTRPPDDVAAAQVHRATGPPSG